MNLDTSFLNIDIMMQMWNQHRIKIIAALALVGGAAGFAVYTYLNHVHKAEAAQVALSETFLEIQRAQHSPEAWQDAEMAAKTAYRQFGKTNLAPYFLSLQAQALVEQGKSRDGLILLQQSLKELSTSSPLYYMLALKIARIKLDDVDAALQQEGLRELESLSYNIKNNQRDAALYYLGLYYDQHNDPKAAQIWQEIIEIGKKQQEIPNMWVTLAQRKIK